MWKFCQLSKEVHWVNVGYSGELHTYWQGGLHVFHGGAKPKFFRGANPPPPYSHFQFLLYFEEKKIMKIKSYKVT